MDYVKFEKAKELFRKIEQLSYYKEKVERFYNAKIVEIDDALGPEDYKKVIKYAVDMIDKRIEEAEDQFRQL